VRHAERAAARALSSDGSPDARGNCRCIPRRIRGIGVTGCHGFDSHTTADQSAGAQSIIQLAVGSQRQWSVNVLAMRTCASVPADHGDWPTSRYGRFEPVVAYINRRSIAHSTAREIAAA